MRRIALILSALALPVALPMAAHGADLIPGEYAMDSRDAPCIGATADRDVWHAFDAGAGDRVVVRVGEGELRHLFAVFAPVGEGVDLTGEAPLARSAIPDPYSDPAGAVRDETLAFWAPRDGRYALRAQDHRTFPRDCARSGGAYALDLVVRRAVWLRIGTLTPGRAWLRARAYGGGVFGPVLVRAQVGGRTVTIGRGAMRDGRAVVRLRYPEWATGRVRVQAVMRGARELQPAASRPVAISRRPTLVP